MWPLASYETWCMIAYHSVPFIYDAYAKGFRGFDAELAFQAMRDTAMSGRLRQDGVSQKLHGYIPLGEREGRGHTRARWRCPMMHLVHRARWRRRSARRMTPICSPNARSQNYRNVWDPTTRFFRSKKADGTWQEPFDPKQVSNGRVPAAGYYTEANAWQYAFAVFHDVTGMIQLYGGREAFINRLDELFNQDQPEMSHWVIDVSGLDGRNGRTATSRAITWPTSTCRPARNTRPRIAYTTSCSRSTTTHPRVFAAMTIVGRSRPGHCVFSALGLYPLNPANGEFT